jgi:malto-oligosyltrehalose synthase
MSRPDATYRFQLHAEFTLHDLAERVPYLARLGISHVYLSPIMEARAGSAHGYDVVDTCCVAESLGGEAALAALAGRLDAHGMGVLLDVVPNHMAASSENAWWRDLLEHGPASEHVRTFDTPWTSEPSGRLRLPVLADPLPDVLARGELTIAERDGAPVVAYFDHWFPVPASARALAGHAAGTPEAMSALLDALPYELVHWKHVNEEVCYRRFFDVADLIGMRVEEPDVFARTHQGILTWIRNGWVDGLRIDHVDGLRDPERYLDELAEATAAARGGDRCYTVVEKILAADEHIPASWQTDGATGYEFTRALTGFLLDRNGYAQLDALRRRWTGVTEDLTTFIREKKRYVLEHLFRAELADAAGGLAAAGLLPGDGVLMVLRELTVALPVYRTYITERGVSTEDRRRIEAAGAAARAQLEPEHHPVLDDVCAILLLERTHASESALATTIEAIARWQQLTGPVMAKGFEDTALYAWPALLAVNEVGGDPGEALAVGALHALLRTRAADTPGALNATSTHDTKRSEDVRARLLVLAEHPDMATELSQHWRTHPASAQLDIAPRDQIVLLQTLIGIWPLDDVIDETLAGRVREFMRKAAREAKTETSWLEPDAAYEQRLDRAVDHVLMTGVGAQLRTAIGGVAQRIALHGACNSLNQLLLKCTAPGVPDVYQGTESWRFDLVDPDNRRPVDFARLEASAAALAPLVAAPDADAVRALMASWRDGLIKQYVLTAALACRRRNAAFRGDYRALDAAGEHARSIVAFERVSGTDRVLVIATRYPGKVAPLDAPPAGDSWADTYIEAPPDADAWHSVLTGERVPVVAGRIELRSALALLPCALLEPG